MDLPVLFLLDASTSLSRKSERKIDVYGYIPKGSDGYFLIRSIESALQLFAAHAHEKEQVKEFCNAIKVFQQKEEKTEALLQALPDHLFIFNENGTFLEYHVSRSHSLFIQPKQFLGKKMHELFPKDISTTAQELITEALRTGKIQTFEYQLKISDASRYFEAHLSPFEKDKVLCIVRENTTLKESEA